MPDPSSRSQEHGGRRLVEEGRFLYFMPTYSYYRGLRDEDERREQARGRMRRLRSARRQAGIVRKVRPSSPSFAQGEEEGDKDNTSAGSRPTRSPADAYPEAFERTWAIYPQRAGGNPKRRAFKAWSARHQAGVTAEEMHAGVERYARFCEVTHKTGTEYVKQAATFFGPDEHFRESWSNPGGDATESDPVAAAYAQFEDVTEELSR